MHKGSTQTNKRFKKGFKFKRSKKPSVPWSGAPDCPVCHRTVSGAPGWIDFKLFTFGFLRSCSAIIHRTVRCTSGAMALAQRSTATDACKSATVCGQFAQSQSSPQKAHWTVNSACLVRHRTVRCHMKTKLQRSKPSEP